MEADRERGHEPWVQTPETIEKMRLASKIAANALAEAGKAVAPASPPTSSTVSRTTT